MTDNKVNPTQAADTTAAFLRLAKRCRHAGGAGCLHRLSLRLLPGFPVAAPPRPARFWQGLLINFFIMAVYAMSYDLLMGYIGILSFGQAAFFGGGAYAMAHLLQARRPRYRLADGKFHSGLAPGPDPVDPLPDCHAAGGAGGRS